MGGMGMIADHVDHEWIQSDKCVYCLPCQVRLYQGRLGNPENRVRHAKFLDDIITAARNRAARPRG